MPFASRFEWSVGGRSFMGGLPASDITNLGIIRTNGSEQSLLAGAIPNFADVSMLMPIATFGGDSGSGFSNMISGRSTDPVVSSGGGVGLPEAPAVTAPPAAPKAFSDVDVDAFLDTVHYSDDEDDDGDGDGDGSGGKGVGGNST